MIRLAHFVQRYPPALGGSEAYMARLSRYHVQAGDEVEVYTTTGDALDAFWDRRASQLPPGEEWVDGVQVHRLPLVHLPLGHRYWLKAASLIPLPSWQALTMPFNPIVPQMWRLARQPGRAFDAVHASAFPYSFPLACAARLARTAQVPLFLTPFVHIGDPDDPRDRVRKAYTTPALMNLARSAARLFVQTQGEAETLVRLGIPAERVILQGLGVDLESCTGGDRRWARQRWGLEDQQVVIGHLANNSYEKGSIDLLLAAERAWARGGRFAVVLAGTEMPNFRAFWSQHHSTGTIVRFGRLSDEEKRDFFAGIDAFALPSRSDSFGLVFPEAWANGVPCVGYRAGGVPWVIRDGVDGRVVRCGDLEELAGVLLEWSASAKVRHELGEAGRARLGEFAWDQKLALVRREIVNVLESHRVGQGE
ncbi:MAG: glycosyltransferase family 4 protein [Gemmataceae bacterium]